MGKRKLHDKTYYQCDWTAIPMDSPACYMPSFDGKKLKKRGNYCNWESVVRRRRSRRMSTRPLYYIK